MVPLTQSRNFNKETSKAGKIAYVGIGLSELNEFGKRLQSDFGADVFTFSYKDGQEKANEILKSVPKDGKYDAIIVGIHNYSLRPADNFGISAAAINLYKQLNFIKTVTLTFGNVLATKNFCDAWTLLACYQDDAITQQAAADYLSGKFELKGKLPVSVCRFKFGEGIVKNEKDPSWHHLEQLAKADSVVNDAIAQKIFPGSVVLAVHEGEIIYHKAFGQQRYEASSMVNQESIFDLASVTKISATTVSVMKLYEQGNLALKKKLDDYLPLASGTNKANLRIDDMLLHQAGLVPFIPFYKETTDDKTGQPNPSISRNKPKKGWTVRVAENI